MFLHCCSVGFSRRTVKLLDGKRHTGYGLGTTSFGWNHKGLGQGIFNIVLLDIVLLEHTLPPPPPSLGGTLYCAYTGRIRPKGVPFSGLRYFRGFISIREGNFVNLVYKELPALDETIRNWVKVFSTLKSCIVGSHLWPPPPPFLGGTLYCAYTGNLRPKGVPFPGFRNMRGLFSIREGNFVNLVYIKE